MRPRRLTAAAAALLVLLAVPAAGVAAGAGAPPPPQGTDVDGDCHDDLPDRLELAGGSPVVVSVLLVVDDGIPTGRALQVAVAIRRLFEPAGLDVRVRTKRLSVEGRDARVLIDRVRTRLGGKAPVGVDLVHLLTPVDLTSQGDDSSIGLADCIGGIRDPLRAFSVSEMTETVRNISLGPVTGSGDEEARSAAHELGHLLGARHEHADCVEGAGTSAPTDSPCTIMFLAAPSSDVFGVLEAAVIRGYARQYAG